MPRIDLRGWIPPGRRAPVPGDGTVRHTCAGRCHRLIGGLGAGGINPILGAVEYERVLRQLQARVLGALNASAWAGIPVGSLAAGPAVSSLGLRTALLSAAVIYAMATLPPFFFPVWRQMDSVSRATPPHPSPERQEALPHDQGQTIGHKL